MTVIHLNSRRDDRVPPFISFSKTIPANNSYPVQHVPEAPIALDVPPLPEVDQGFMVNASGINWTIALAVCSAAMGCGGFAAWAFLQAMKWWLG